MSDQACCAHLTLKYDTEPVGNGAVRGFWRCQDCKTKFGLEPLAPPSVSGETAHAPESCCGCVCHKVGIFGLMCCPCAKKLLDELVNGKPTETVTPPEAASDHNEGKYLMRDLKKDEHLASTPAEGPTPKMTDLEIMVSRVPPDAPVIGTGKEYWGFTIFVHGKNDFVGSADDLDTCLSMMKEGLSILFSDEFPDPTAEREGPKPSPRCPKCGASVRMYKGTVNDAVSIIWVQCRGENQQGGEEHKFKCETVTDFWQFFTPSAGDKDHE